MNLLERFWEIETDLEPLGLCRWSLVPSECVPQGGVVFASLGVDGIQFCVLPVPKDDDLSRSPVYAVSPMNPDHPLEPLAENLPAFFSLVVQAGDAGTLESASYCTREEFEDAVADPGFGDAFNQERLQSSVALRKAFPFKKIPDPYGYLEAMRARYPRNILSIP